MSLQLNQALESKHGCLCSTGNGFIENEELDAFIMEILACIRKNTVGRV